MDHTGLIDVQPGVRSGKPCFVGTRIAVYDVLDAGEHDYVIVSKDSDFRQLAFLMGPPPKTMWLRVGNRSTAEIAAFLRSSADVITRSASSDEEALLVLPDLDA